MLDIGWPELMVIIVITILVVGPQEIPKVLKTIRDIIARVRGMAREFTNQMDEVVRESELENYKAEAVKLASGDNDIKDYMTSTMDPEGDIQKTIDENTKDMAEQMQEIARKTNVNFKTDTREITDENINDDVADDNADGNKGLENNTQDNHEKINKIEHT